MESKKKSHVLILPYPAQGHINPMLQFCKRLVSRGVKVTIAHTVYIAQSIHINGKSDAETLSVNVETISDGYDDGGYSKAESSEAYLGKLQSVGSRTLADLIKKLDDSGEPVNALVYDAFLPWALDVGKSFGLVGAVFFTQACGVSSIYYHLNRRLISVPLPETAVVSLPGMPDLQLSETPSFVHVYGAYPGFYDMVVNQFSNIDEADWVFFNSFYDLEPEVLDWMGKLWRVKTIGPTIPSLYLDKRLQFDKDYGMSIYKPNSEECMSWLEDKPNKSVVYVSFGSLAVLGAEQMEEIAWGLKEIGANFIWVVREIEQSKLPNKFLEEKWEKGLILTWCPQLEVLAHKSIGCFVTHCGFNSVLEAISLGVPMVALPQWTDQPTNANYVEKVWGMGIKAESDGKGLVRRQALASCVKEVMEGERGKRMRENAVKWKCLARKAVDAGGSSDKNIDEFVAELAESHNA